MRNPVGDAGGVRPEDPFLAHEARRSEMLLRDVLEGTASVIGPAFLHALVQHLARALDVRYVFVAECLPNGRARSRAFWSGDSFGVDFEYDLAGTPCLEVTQGRTCHFLDGLQEAFPENAAIAAMGTRSYLGIPLLNSTRQIIGHLAIEDTRPMPADPIVLSILEMFASRAGAELERARASEELVRLNSEVGALRKIAELEKQLEGANAALKESEERFRDLFDEAPIAYVHEGIDTRFIRANRTAMRILGIKPEEVNGIYGKTFIPDTPDAQQRLKAALESIGRGIDTSGVVLELRRRDNGKPIFIEWWSRPDPSAKYTRTMFLDITDRVLMEQEKARLQAQNIYLQEEIRSEGHFEEIIGSSRVLQEVLQQIEQVAPTDSTVLLWGETGTGKELFARAIHNRSARRKRTLVKVNCGAISAGLVESELFGHVKGAFTGALSSRDGRFKIADGGTIFLDEVGELPPETQVKLLRVLQEHEFEPIGSDRTVKVDVRIIAATNCNLNEAVLAGKFRADLLYRLNVFPIDVPPLRERKSDIPLLAKFFVQQFARKMGRQVSQISEETMRRLTAYSWPGNIRELQNVIERAVILCTGSVVDIAHALGAPPAASPDTAPSGTSLQDAERRHIQNVLDQAKWVIEGGRGAARILGLHPNTLRSKMKKLGVHRPA